MKKCIVGSKWAVRVMVAGAVAGAVLAAAAPASAFDKGDGASAAPASVPVPSAPVQGVPAQGAPAEVPSGFEGSASLTAGLLFGEGVQLGGRAQFGGRVLPFLALGARVGYDRLFVLDGSSMDVNRITVGGYVDLHLGPLGRGRVVDSFFGLGLESSTMLIGFRDQTGFLQSIGVPVRGGINLHASPRYAFHWFVEITPYIPVACTSGRCGDTMVSVSTGLGFAWNDVRPAR